MRHYEVVVMVHPDRSDQVAAMVENYCSAVKDSGGIVHRTEDWGRRQLAYPIQDVYKSHYLLFNFECEPSVIKKLTELFRFNDAVMRNMVLLLREAVTGESPMLQEEAHENPRDRRRPFGSDSRNRDSNRKTDQTSTKTSDIAESSALDQKESSINNASTDDEVKQSEDVVADADSATEAAGENIQGDSV